MKEFKDILHTPTFVLNVDSKSDRWKKTKSRLDEAGFMNYQRWQCADGRNKESILNVWDELGLDNTSFNTLGFDWSGTLAGALSYLTCLKHIIDRKYPYALILEDDIQFHPGFLEKGEYMYNATPENFDMVYLGCQTEFRPCYDVGQGQVYGGWAILYSLEGVKKVYNYLIDRLHKGILNCFDMELYWLQGDSLKDESLSFWIWSTRHYDYAETNPDNWGHGFWDNTKDPFGWEWKWDGIIFPDPNLPSTLDCGCIDPRRLEIRQDIKEKICQDPNRCSKEQQIKDKEDLGFEIY